ncbi:MAG: DUF11 domain-containing protein [Chloroflexi bacterium]|nr:DUF11 domain-containing protein [Chloroflexota bacterium]
MRRLCVVASFLLGTLLVGALLWSMSACTSPASLVGSGGIVQRTLNRQAAKLIALGGGSGAGSAKIGAEGTASTRSLPLLVDDPSADAAASGVGQGLPVISTEASVDVPAGGEPLRQSSPAGHARATGAVQGSASFIGGNARAPLGVNLASMSPEGFGYVAASVAADPELHVNKWLNPGIARPGGVFAYGISYWIEGSETATDTMIVDVLPPWTTYAGDTSGLTPDLGSNGTITWHVGALEPGDSGTFAVTVNVSDTAPTGEGVIAGNCVTITSLTTSAPRGVCSDPLSVENGDVDISVYTWPNPGDPAAGEEIEYTVQVCNNRPTAAGPVVLTDTLPASTALASWRHEQPWLVLFSEVESTNEHLVLSAPGLPGGFCSHLLVRVQVDAGVSVGTELANVVEIAVTDDVDSGNNWAENRDARVGSERIDLNAGTWVNSGILVPGGQIDFGLNYWNAGNTAVQAVLTDAWPAGTTYIPGTALRHDGQLFDPDVSTAAYAAWDLGTLAVQSGSGLDVSVAVDPSVAPGAVLTNCVQAGHEGFETTPWDNAACVATTIYPSGLPNLFVHKQNYGYGSGQGTINYQIQFGNFGDQPVENVVIIDAYPLSTTSDWPGWDWWDDIVVTDNYTESQWVFHINRIDPGQRGFIDVNANLQDPSARMMWYTNSVTITTPSNDANPDDNVALDVVFSGGEIDRFEADLSETNAGFWGQAVPESPVTVTTPYSQVTAWARGDCGGCWDVPEGGPLQPGDVITVEADRGMMPIVYQIPDPFSVQPDSDTNQVWGEVAGGAGDFVDINGDWGASRRVRIDDEDQFIATFGDVPRGATGEVLYETIVNYATVVVHRRFQAQDLVLRVNLSGGDIQGSYPAGHTVWLTLTDGLGSLKGTAARVTTPYDDWGNQPGFHIPSHEWSPSQITIEPGDLLYAMSDDGRGTELTVGLITGTVDSSTDSVSGRVYAAWFEDDLFIECHPWGAPEGAPGKQSTAGPDGDPVYFCQWDPATEWDVLPGQDIGVWYVGSDGNWVGAGFREPAPRVWIGKWTNDTPAAGGAMEFTISYGNEGEVDAESVWITDTLDGLTYLTDTLGIAPNGSGGVVGWPIGTLAPGAQGEFRVYAQVDAGQDEAVTNTAAIETATPFDQGGPEMKQSYWTGQVAAGDAEINIGKWSWTGEPAAGYSLIFEVNPCNNGSTASGEVILTDTLHPSLTLQSWWGGQLGWQEASHGDHELVVTRASLSNHSCSPVYVRAQVDADAWVGMEISNTARVSVAGDTSPDNDDASWMGYVGHPWHDLSISKGWNWGQIVPGGELRYNVSYHNAGNLPVTGTIYITDTFPVGTTFREAFVHGQTPIPLTPAYVDGEYAVWQISGLENGFNEGFEVVLDVDASLGAGTLLTNCAEIDAGVFENDPYNNQSCVVEELQEAGTNLRVTLHEQWHGRNDVQYQVQVENIGTTPVHNVAVTETFPVSMTLQWWNVDFWEEWNGNESGNQITATLSQLQPGWSGWLSVGLGVPDVPNGTWFTNIAEVTTPPEDVNPVDNTDVLISSTGPDLMVEKWLTGGVAAPGELLTYTLRFANQSDHWDTVGEVVLSDTLPDDTELVSAVLRLCGDSFFCDASPDTVDGNTATWNHGNWPPNAWNEMLVTVRVTDTAEGGDILTNTAEILSTDANEGEATLDNNQAVVAATVVAPRLVVDKVYTGNRVAGTVVTYTLHVTNTGNAVATGVVLTDVVPSGLTYGGGGLYAAGTVSWTIPSISSAGGAETRSFTGTLPCAAGESVANDRYGVVASDQGPTSPPGPTVAFTTIAPTIQAQVSYAPAAIGIGDTVYLTATAGTDGTPPSFAWAFGDGATGVGPTVAHTYVEGGAYTVTLTATDSCGFQAVKTQRLVVSGFVYVPSVLRNYTSQAGGSGAP